MELNLDYADPLKTLEKLDLYKVPSLVADCIATSGSTISWGAKMVIIDATPATG